MFAFFENHNLWALVVRLVFIVRTLTIIVARPIWRWRSWSHRNGWSICVQRLELDLWLVLVVIVVVADASTGLARDLGLQTLQKCWCCRIICKSSRDLVFGQLALLRCHHGRSGSGSRDGASRAELSRSLCSNHHTAPALSVAARPRSCIDVLQSLYNTGGSYGIAVCWPLVGITRDRPLSPHHAWIRTPVCVTPNGCSVAQRCASATPWFKAVLSAATFSWVVFFFHFALQRQHDGHYLHLDISLFFITMRHHWGHTPENSSLTSWAPLRTGYLQR